MRKPKGTPTRTNLFVLREHFAGRDEAPAKCESTSYEHLRRCMAAGLCVANADRTALILTETGKAAIK